MNTKIRMNKSRHNWLFRILMIVGIVAIIPAIFMIVAIAADVTDLQNEMQDGYLPFDRIAVTICTIPTNVENKVWVDFNLYNQNGKVIKALRQPINGEQARLQGVILDYQQFMQFVGLQSGYKLILLQGYYTRTGKGSTPQPTSIPLNGGTDDKFKQLYKNASPGVTASVDSPFTVPADGKTYNLYTTSNGLLSRLAPHQIKACGATS